MLKLILGVTVNCECISLIAAIVLIRTKLSAWRLFVPFLFITALADVVGSYGRLVLKNSHFELVYNILLIISIAFYVIFFTAYILMNVFRKLFIYMLSGFFVFALFNLFFFQGLFRYNFYSEVLGDCIIILVVGCFFYTILTNETYVGLFTDSFFWLSSGLLMFSLGSIVLYIFRPVIVNYYQDTCINLGGSINDILNVILFASFITAFVCQKKTRSLPV
jgi:hypothetical protein